MGVTQRNNANFIAPSQGRINPPHTNEMHSRVRRCARPRVEAAGDSDSSKRHAVR